MWNYSKRKRKSYIIHILQTVIIFMLDFYNLTIQKYNVYNVVPEQLGTSYWLIRFFINTV